VRIQQVTVKYERNEGVATITIAGAGPRHRLAPGLCAELNARLAAFDDDPTVTVCVLRGAGAAHFSAGATAWPAATRTPISRPVKPVIAAITGDCLGEALAIVAQASDVRIAGAGARFGFPEDDGLGTLLARSRLLQQIPYAPLMALLLTGGTIDAAEALRIGLITQVVPDAEVFTQALAIARRVDQLPPYTTRLEKTAILACEHLNAADAVYFGWAFDCMTHRHPDGLEGVSSWVEKREPHFWRFEKEG
jgi:enoyl-CoA hydratase/carnithine racemase